VSVRRGTVWVSQRGERRVTLGAGSKWLSRTEAPVARAEASPSEPARTSASPAEARSSRAAQAEGTLAEENRLYEAALAARNTGDDRRAAEAFGQLLARYPRSVLGEQSLAERFRALDRSGQVSSVAAAAIAAIRQFFAHAAERVSARGLRNRSSAVRREGFALASHVHMRSVGEATAAAGRFRRLVAAASPKSSLRPVSCHHHHRGARWASWRRHLLPPSTRRRGVAARVSGGRRRDGGGRWHGQGHLNHRGQAWDACEAADDRAR
jgi:hypothetical protein